MTRASTPATSAPTTVVTAAGPTSKPVNTAYPYVTGIEQVGQTLTAGNGSWSGNPTSYTYQWFNSSTGSIHGQTSSTYVAKVGDLGCYVTVKVVKHVTALIFGGFDLRTGGLDLASDVAPEVELPRGVESMGGTTNGVPDGSADLARLIMPFRLNNSRSYGRLVAIPRREQTVNNDRQIRK